MVDKRNDDQDVLKKQFNDERIRAWREQRLAAAEIEREMRVKAAKHQRQEEIEAQTFEKKRLAQEKLPSLEKIYEKRASILQENQRLKREFFKKLGILALISACLTFFISCFTTAFYEAEAVVTIKTHALNDNASNASILPTAVSPNIMQYIFSAREYIFSRDMMNRMEKGQGFISYFKQKDMHRLSAPFWNDYRYYKDRVKVAVDIQEGLLRIKVQAKNQKDAKHFADELLRYAERWVNSLSDRMFTDKIKEAEETLFVRTQKLRNARKRIVNFQIAKKDLNPRETIATIYQHLNDIKTRIKQSERNIAVYKSAQVNNSPVVDRLRADLVVLKEQHRNLNRRLIDKGDRSMNKILSGFESALISKDVAEKEWEVALNALEKIKVEVFNQRQYFLTIVPPISSPDPVEPQFFKLFLLIAVILYSLMTLFSLLKTSLNISLKTVWK